MRQLLDKVVDVPVFVVVLDTVEVPQLQFVKGLESRASVTCLLGVGAGGRRRRASWALEQGVVELFVGVKGVCDVLARRWSRCC